MNNFMTVIPSECLVSLSDGGQFSGWIIEGLRHTAKPGQLEGGRVGRRRREGEGREEGEGGRVGNNLER